MGEVAENENFTAAGAHCRIGTPVSKQRQIYCCYSPVYANGQVDRTTFA